MDAHSLIDRRRMARRLVLWRLLAVAGLALAAIMAVGEGRSPGLSGPIVGPHVARVTVDGLIGDDPDRTAAILALAEDDRVKAVLVRIDSGGGTATGGESLYSALRKVAEKKPVVATIGTLGASAAYMTAIAADRVFVRETSITGSIGVIMEAPEASGLLERVGIAVNTLKSAPLKGQPSFTDKMTPEGRAYLQAMIDDSFAYFRGMVGARRNLKDEALDRVADGRAFTGRQALALGLVDALGGEAEARDWLAAQKGVSKDLPVRPLRNPEEDGWVASVVPAPARKMLFGEWVKLDGLVSVWHP